MALGSIFLSLSHASVPSHVANVCFFRFILLLERLLIPVLHAPLHPRQHFAPACGLYDKMVLVWGKRHDREHVESSVRIHHCRGLCSLSVLLLEKIQRHQFCRTFFAQWHGAQFVAHLEPTALVLLASAFKFVLTATISEATAMTTVRRRKRRTRRRKWKQVTLTGDHPQAGLMCVSHSLSWPQKVISKFHPERRFPKIPDAASSLGLLTSFFVCVCVQVMQERVLQAPTTCENCIEDSFPGAYIRETTPPPTQLRAITSSQPSLRAFQEHLMATSDSSKLCG